MDAFYFFSFQKRNPGPDVIASYTAAGQSVGTTATFLAVGSILGANLFTTTVVLFRVLLNSDSIQMQYQTILRDMIFFILATATIIAFGIVGKITWEMTLGYLGIYLTYIVIVLIQERSLEGIGDKKEGPEGETDEEGRQPSITVKAKFSTGASIANFGEG